MTKAIHDADVVVVTQALLGLAAQKRPLPEADERCVKVLEAGEPQPAVLAAVLYAAVSTSIAVRSAVATRVDGESGGFWQLISVGVKRPEILAAACPVLAASGGKERLQKLAGVKDPQVQAAAKKALKTVV